MSKRSTLKRILITLGILAVLLVVGTWIFYRYYFQDYVNDFLKPKLRDAIAAATEGHYRLDIGTLVYRSGSLYCTGFNLHRVRYDNDEKGITLEKLTEDTVYFTGLHLLDLIKGNGSFMKRMEMHHPKISVIEVADGRKKIALEKTDSFPIPQKLPERLPVIAFDSVILSDIEISVPKQFQPQGSDTVYKNASARLGGFRLDSVTMLTEPIMYSTFIHLELPSVHFQTEDKAYTIEAGPIHADLADSVIRIDSFSLKPNYNEEEFSALSPYVRGRLDFHCTQIHIRGFELEKVMNGESVALHKCGIAKWSFDYYSDKRKPHEIHPPAAVMPNDFMHEFPMAVNIDSLELNEGKIRIRERAPGSKQAGYLSFDRVRITAYPYCTDSLCENVGKPTEVSISALFLGEAPVTAKLSYELQHKQLDMEGEATVGKFSPKLLNTFLVPNERKEVTDGTVEGGKLHLKITDGSVTMTVTPYYKELSMKILPEKSGESGGLLEGLKTFVANTFVLKSENMDKPGSPAMSSTTVLHREPQQEFLQFIWIALRKSLGKIIGGFD